MPFEVYIPPAAKLRTVDNAVHVPAFIFCRDRDALDHDALRTRLPWLAPPAQAQKPITLHLSVRASVAIVVQLSSRQAALHGWTASVPTT